MPDENIRIFQSTSCDFAGTFPPAPTGSGVLMTDDSAKAAALIKELLVLNRTESSPESAGRTAEQVEKRGSMRKRLRQELVQVLYLRDRKKS
jgi:hypothetical protein